MHLYITLTYFQMGSLKIFFQLALKCELLFVLICPFEYIRRLFNSFFSYYLFSTINVCIYEKKLILDYSSTKTTIKFIFLENIYFCFLLHIHLYAFVYHVDLFS